MSVSTLIEVFCALFLLLCSAMISGSEVAYFSLSPAQLKKLNSSGNRQSGMVLKLLEHPKELLATILIGNNLVNVAIIVLFTYLVGTRFDFSAYPLLAFFVQVVAITFLILLFGEVTPKVYATANAYRMAMIMAYPLAFMKSVFKPISSLMVASTTIIDKRIARKGSDITVDELSHAIELTREEGVSEDDEKILQGIVKFGETDVKQIMTPRLDVVAFDISTGYVDLRDGIINSGFSRIPIYRDDFDTIEGLLYIKDLLPYLSEADKFNWKHLIRKPFFVPETKKIDDLLREFQEKKMHMAIVVDEYGGSSGIVTLEDIIEEVVGEITDEFDDDKMTFTKVDKANYIFEGKTPLNDFYRILDIDGDDFEQTKGEADTVAGFVIELAGKIPLKNEKIDFGDYIFTIEAADKRRVKEIKVTLPDTGKEQGGEKGSYGAGLSAILIILLIIAAAMSACTEHYIPKPRGFFRIELPTHAYRPDSVDCPYHFEYSTHAQIDTTARRCNLNIFYPAFDCKLHLTYFPVEDTLREYIEESRALAMKHIAKASGIEEELILIPVHHVYGLVYRLEGNTASGCQFYLTDSSSHFLRGALYFNTPPNEDSIAPVEEYMEKDIRHFINTLTWN